MIVEDISVNEAVRARRDVAQHTLLSQQVVLRRFRDFVSNCLVEPDAFSALLSNDADGLNGNPHALMLLERIEGLYWFENSGLVDRFDGNAHTESPKIFLDHSAKRS
jgi:hypothetical protein